MKTFRLLLLVLLALVLPFRGALANVAYCAGGPGALEHAVSQPHDHGPAQGDHDGHHEHHEHAADHAADHASVGSAPGEAADPSAGGSVDRCNLCSASCSATPFVSAPPDLPTPVVVAQAAYPALCAPPPSHPSEGQERPPRRI